MSAGLKAGQELAVAVESSYGSPDPANYTSAAVGALTFNRVTTLRKSIPGLVSAGEIPLYDEPTVGVSAAGQPPEIDMPYAAGGSTPVAVSRGDVAVDAKLTLPGSTAFASTRLGEMLASSLGLLGKSAGVTQAVTAAVSTTVYVVGAGDIGDTHPGDVVAWVGATGTTEFACVTSVNTGTNRVTVHPAFSAAPQIADTIRLCSVLYPAIGARGATSLAWKYLDASRGLVVTGSRLRRLELAFAGGATSTAEARMLFSGPFRGDIAGATPSGGSAIGGGVTAKRYGAVISGALSGSAPEAGARTVYGVRSWEATIDIGLDEVGTVTASPIQCTDQEIVSVDASVRLRFSDSQRPTLLSMLRAQTRSTWVFPLQGEGGKGCALIIPGGYVENVTGDTIEEERSFSEVVIRPGNGDIADTTGTPRASRNAHIMLAVVS